MASKRKCNVVCTDGDCTMKSLKKTGDKMDVVGYRRSARRRGDFDWKMADIRELNPIDLGFTTGNDWDKTTYTNEASVKGIHTFIFNHTIPNIYSISNDDIDKRDEHMCKDVVVKCLKEKLKYVPIDDSGMCMLVSNESDSSSLIKLDCFKKMTKSLYDPIADAEEAKKAAEDADNAKKAAEDADKANKAAEAINHVDSLSEVQKEIDSWVPVRDALYTYLGNYDMNHKKFINNLHEIARKYKYTLIKQSTQQAIQRIDVSKLHLYSVEFDGTFYLDSDNICESDIQEFPSLETEIKLSKALDELSDMIYGININSGANGGGKSKNTKPKKNDKTVKKTPVKPKKESVKKTSEKTDKTKPVKSKKPTTKK